MTADDLIAGILGALAAAIVTAFSIFAWPAIRAGRARPRNRRSS